ncbi:MAG TPA: type II secretion system F family protein [Candidatus Acidoferrum sp.]|jgi:flagellar protein FlaJ|nr:type II secretion system F family protein [Candidatus Acidoferrum sp.]
MKSNKVAEKIKTLFSHLARRLKLHSTKIPSSSQTVSQHSPKLTLESPHSIAYQLIGQKIEHILPIFRDLDLNLERSDLKVSFRAYVSLSVFASVLVSLGTLIIVPCLLFFVFSMQLVSAILFGVGISLFAGAFSVIGFYFYPIYRADALKRALEDELPFTTGYMSILTGAGVSPEKIFYSLSNLSVPLAVSNEAKNIVRNVNLFGSDIISALEEASKRTPSEKFREMLEGFISTVHSGSNLTAYLHEKSKHYMKLKRISLKKFADTLSMLSEFYVAVLLTGPLMLVIMLSVMAMLGGDSLGFLSPDLLLQMLTYVGIPLGAIIFLIILDATSPKW